MHNEHAPPKSNIVTIFEPITHSKLRRNWTAVVGGIEFSGASREAVEVQVSTALKADPFVKKVFQPELNPVERPQFGSRLTEATAHLDAEQSGEAVSIEPLVVASPRDAAVAIVSLRYYSYLLEKGISAHDAREEIWGHESIFQRGNG